MENEKAISSCGVHWEWVFIDVFVSESHFVYVELWTWRFGIVKQSTPTRRSATRLHTYHRNEVSRPLKSYVTTINRNEIGFFHFISHRARKCVYACRSTTSKIIFCLCVSIICSKRNKTNRIPSKTHTYIVVRIPWACVFANVTRNTNTFCIQKIACRGVRSTISFWWKWGIDRMFAMCKLNRHPRYHTENKEFISEILSVLLPGRL